MADGNLVCNGLGRRGSRLGRMCADQRRLAPITIGENFAKLMKIDIPSRGGRGDCVMSTARDQRAGIDRAEIERAIAMLNSMMSACAGGVQIDRIDPEGILHVFHCSCRVPSSW
jgi:hypothetical protein